MYDISNCHTIPLIYQLRMHSSKRLFLKGSFIFHNCDFLSHECHCIKKMWPNCEYIFFFHKFYSLQLWLHVKSANLYLTITTSYFTNDKFISHIWLVKCGFISYNYNLISHKYDLICQNCSFISQNYEYVAQPDYFPLLYI